ncbi:hypothetical protein EHQ58_09905 [Leptospira ognonensis]|uniref:Uncharacterized protein n=1 Tax=Leptospira ognonensis TaxID=2484945 RepID=A0A4R9K0N5_9LEPT|nr:hypothetical protein [Leptospira ognonensis]TGL59213.1 hypothetical protein EHQ58_09905 [Leptospira ognonensis]
MNKPSNFNLNLKIQVFKTIMQALRWDQRFLFVIRFLMQKAKIKKSDFFHGSDFALENRERFKLQLDILALHAALKQTIGDDRALRTMISVLQTSASEAFLETMQLITKLTSMK